MSQEYGKKLLNLVWNVTIIIFKCQYGSPLIICALLTNNKRYDTCLLLFQGTGNIKRALKLAYLEKTGPKMANMSKKKS
jgi:hypothetical protein